MDLRFEDQADELAYRQSGDPDRARHVAFVVSVTVFVTLTDQLLWLREEFAATVEPLRWSDASDVRWVHALVVLLFIAFGGVIALMACMRVAGRDCLPAVGDEALVGIWYISVFFFVAFLRRRSLLVFSDPGAAWRSRIESGEVAGILAMDACVTVLCISGVARMRLCVLLVASSFLLWSLSVAVFGTSQPNGGAVPLLFLLTLYAFALSGAWHNERFTRREWGQRRTIREQEVRLIEQSALVCGMRAVAERLCDFVLSLGEGLEVCVDDCTANGFFGRSMLGRCLTSEVVESDRLRLALAFQQASESRIPQCLQVTLQEHGRNLEARLLLTDTGGSQPKYIVGLSVESGAPVEPTGPVCLKKEIEAACEVSSPETTAEAHRDSDAGTTFTGDVFASSSLERVERLALDEGWCIRPDELEVPVPTWILGRGGFGVVAAAVFHGQAVAVKMLHGVEDRRGLSALLNELRVLRHIRHPNVVVFFGGVIQPHSTSAAIVYELIHGVQLDRVVKQSDPSRVNRFRLLFDVSSALRYLHSQSPAIVHSDLKGGNVMVEETSLGLRAKVIDFGLSRFLTGGLRKLGGSIGWSAPEQFQQRGANRSVYVDVFAFGWLTKLVVTGEGPHSGMQGDKLRAAIGRMLRKRKVPPVVLPEGTPFRQDSETLCKACLQFDPADRPDMHVVQAFLRTWLPPTDASELDFASATAMQSSVSWLEGQSDLHAAAMASAGTSELRCAELQVSTAEGFRVMSLHRDRGMACEPLPEVGDCFLDWLASPADFQLVVLATLNDIQRGAKAAPLVMMCSGIVLVPPGRDGAERPLRRFFGEVLFSGAGGRIGLRLCGQGGDHGHRQDHISL